MREALTNRHELIILALAVQLLAVMEKCGAKQFRVMETILFIIMDERVDYYSICVCIRSFIVFVRLGCAFVCVCSCADAVRIRNTADYYDC